MRWRSDRTFGEGEEPPPPGVRTMAIVRWLLLAAVVLAAFSPARVHLRRAAARRRARHAR